jgi:hypothetical protein
VHPEPPINSGILVTEQARINGFNAFLIFRFKCSILLVAIAAGEVVIVEVEWHSVGAEYGPDTNQ